MTPITKCINHFEINPDQRSAGFVPSYSRCITRAVFLMIPARSYFYIYFRLDVSRTTLVRGPIWSLFNFRLVHFRSIFSELSLVHARFTFLISARAYNLVHGSLYDIRPNTTYSLLQDTLSTIRPSTTY